MSFKVGDKVRCINSSNFVYITKNRIYEVVDIDHGTLSRARCAEIKVKNVSNTKERNPTSYYPIKLFELVKENTMVDHESKITNLITKAWKEWDTAPLAPERHATVFLKKYIREAYFAGANLQQSWSIMNTVTKQKMNAYGVWNDFNEGCFFTTEEEAKAAVSNYIGQETTIIKIVSNFV